ncbi:MAG: hypothetical protein ABJB09_01680 [Verrucomicrobiota bacterium]
MKLRTIALLFLALSNAQAVILLRTGDPTANTSTTSSALVASLWRLQGTWGAFLGTPVAPHFFLSATHIGNAGGGVFIFQNVSYTVVEGFSDPASDLTLWRVAETFPAFAPLYTRSDEVKKRVIVLGRGTQRGGDMFINKMLRGWGWGAWDSVSRWGENVVSAIVSGGPGNDYLYATFDQNGLPNESHLSVGDSGGAAFVQEDGVWKLAGIHYAVDGPFYIDASGNGGFNGALFDARGFYVSDDANPPVYTLISGPNPVPTGFYSTRVSSRLAWIYSVILPSPATRLPDPAQ